MDHTREHRSVLASAEKRALIAIARRLPGWLSSDHLTLLGLLSMPVAGLGFARIGTSPWSPWVIAGALLANWLGDSLDGTVARVRCRQRPRYGFYVDHVIDLAGTAVLLMGMGASGRIEPAIAIAVLAAYLLVSAETYLATHTAGVFRLSLGGIGPTELRILLAAGSFCVAGHPWVELGDRQVLLLDVSGVIAVAGLVLAFVASSIRNARALYLAEPLPPSSGRPLPARTDARPSTGIDRTYQSTGSGNQSVGSC